MADSNHTLEFSSAQENSAYIVNLTVQEIFASAPKGLGCIAMSVIPPQYDPCIILQGGWLRELGFNVGDSVRVLGTSTMLSIMPSGIGGDADCILDVSEDGLLSFPNFKEEIDDIKAEKGDTLECKVGGDNSRKSGRKNCGTGSDKSFDTDDGKKVGRKKVRGKKKGGKKGRSDRGSGRAKNAIKETATSEDASDVLTRVKRGLDHD